jgi:hypothetical protein
MKLSSKYMSLFRLPHLAPRPKTMLSVSYWMSARTLYCNRIIVHHLPYSLHISIAVFIGILLL